MQGWFKAKSAAKYCGVGERTVRAWLKEDGLRSSRVRGTILIKREWLDEFIEQHEVGRRNDLESIVDEIVRGFQN